MVLRMLALAGALAVSAAHAQKEQFVPATFHWVAPSGTAESSVATGMLDYLRMLNARDGGVNGVKFTWGTTHSVVDKVPTLSIGYGRADAAYGRVFAYEFPLITTYGDQAAAMVRYLAGKEGGFDRLRGRKVALVHHDSAYGKEPVAVLALVHHDSAYGKEPVAVLTDLAHKYGYELMTIAVPDPGTEQQSQWQQVRQLRPDWVILWGWGAMNPVALRAAAKIGYPRTKMIGAWWSGAEEDMLQAGNAAEGFVAAGVNAAGTDYPVIRAIQKHVDGKAGSIYYNRGVVLGIVAAEAVRIAQARFGKGKPVTGEQVQWALEHLDIDSRRLRELGAAGFLPPLKTSCADHAGSGAVRFLRWEGARWNSITDWLPPAPEDARLVRARYERSALEYAKEHGVKPRNCT
jgi:branched-chain amino acid transport system substrate-binding protein